MFFSSYQKATSIFHFDALFTDIANVSLGLRFVLLTFNLIYFHFNLIVMCIRNSILSTYNQYRKCLEKNAQRLFILILSYICGREAGILIRKHCIPRDFKFHLVIDFRTT